MRKTLLLIFGCFCCIALSGQVGINNTNPKATLDVMAKNSDGSSAEGLLAPRLTGDQIQSGNSRYGLDQAGTLIYATSGVSSPDAVTQNITTAGYYYFDGTAWQVLGGSAGVSDYNIYDSDGSLSGNRQVDLSGKNLGFTGGNVGVGIAVADASAILDVSSTTQGFAPPRVTKVQRDNIVSPVSGLIVYCTDCGVGSTGCLSLNLGTPGAPNWSCVGSTTSSTVVTSECTGFSGTYTSGSALSGASYKVTVTNNSFSSATINFSSGDLVLSGITGLTVGTPTFSGGSVSGSNVTLTSGQTVVISYPITGTPGANGTLTGVWTKLSLSCTSSQIVGKGTARFTLPQNLYVASVNLGGTGDVQGVVDNGSNKLTIQVPYTGGKGSYDAYTSAWISNNSGSGQGGDTNKFRVSYPAGTFSSSGSIAVSIEVDGDGSFNALKLLPGNTMVLGTLPFAHNGIYDGDIIIHIVTCGAFIAPGVFKAFMCHNLGADMNADPFQPSASIHGAKYQWGAKTGQAGRYISQADDQANSGAIGGWISSPLPNNSWSDTTKTAQDPCPVGYRVPTNDQWQKVIANNSFTTTGTWTNSPTNYSSGGKFGNTLFLPAAGSRNNVNGALFSRGNNGYYWSSTQYASAYAYNLNFGSTGVNVITNRTNGYSVRCIQE
ncbi:hypothetical protein MTQ00_22160 [Chryseobacterium sp. B21-037]|jgi:uncharacterized protein (TIGR02145 family)|uniref:FISUMP domain-containing protein n=1 Tax=Chryseobacterium sp. B21-037 TaxID=2926038 RepID=UPI00235A2FC5|nr:FISUMP domain-containing protein [Chryseobacterium sp. B21-037]MDC8107195.1 hypothetical protein [Chryseobacterium sp. B21-037]WBV56372.1 FISUMP domain-containing protein [Chryseobacterium daecheongense]WBV56392.1 FISUMP domain-containing protein [Chryseobacterium daecheongense]WBV56405.1 FISUMP domain-containing protein [Chryseobacterium daecheongense]